MKVFVALILCIVAAAPVVGQAPAASSDEQRSARLAELEALLRNGPDMARVEGKAATIQRCRQEIEAHPGNPNAIRLEILIGRLYELDLAESGEPPDFRAAYDTYVTALATLEPSYPYGKRLRLLAARANPDAAARLYEELIRDYPSDEALRVECCYNLGLLAERRGEPSRAAQQFFEDALAQPAAPETFSEADRARIDVYRANAAACLLAAALQRHDSPAGRLKAVHRLAVKYPYVFSNHAELLDRVLESVERRTRPETPPEVAEAIQTLAAALAEDGRMANEESPDRSPASTSDAQPEPPANAGRRLVLSLLVGLAVLVVVFVVARRRA